MGIAGVSKRPPYPQVFKVTKNCIFVYQTSFNSFSFYFLFLFSGHVQSPFVIIFVIILNKNCTLLCNFSSLAMLVNFIIREQ